MRNEQAGILNTIQRARAVLSSLCETWELVLVDDGSTDASTAIVESCARQDDHIRLLRLPGHQGYGSAIRAGLSAARYDIIAYTDADWPCDLTVLSRALPLLEHAEVVAGYRRDRRDSVRRWCYSIVYNAIVRWLFGLRLQDINFSLKLFTRRAFGRLELTSRGSFIDAEMLSAATSAGLRIVQFPVDYLLRQHGQSTLSNLRVILLILREMAAFWWKTRVHRAQIKTGGFSEILGRYTGLFWLYRLYLRERWAMCPFELIEQHVPRRGVLLDYGCGYGLFTHLLRTRSRDRVVIGYDPDVRRIRVAQTSANGEAALVFTEHDPLSRDGHRYDGISLIDVLPYLSVEEGIVLLRRCYTHLTPGGVLIVKDVHHQPRWKFGLTCLQELLVVHVLRWTWTKRGRVAFWGSEQFQRVFNALGWEVERFDLSRGFFYPHMLWRLVKPAELNGRETDEPIEEAQMTATEKPPLSI